MQKEYNITDFFTKSNHEKSKKMELLLDDEKTGHHFMVKGSEAPTVQRDKVVAQVGYAKTAELIEGVKDKIEKECKKRELNEEIEIDYAMSLIEGWSFKDCSAKDIKKLLQENRGLALSVISFSSTNSNYLQKK